MKANCVPSNLLLYTCFKVKTKLFISQWNENKEVDYVFCKYLFLYAAINTLYYAKAFIKAIYQVWDDGLRLTLGNVIVYIYIYIMMNMSFIERYT